MKISSPDFADNGAMPLKFTRDGENLRPTIRLSDVPPGAKSLVVIMDDPDAPMGTFLHWTAWNIPPDTSEIPGDSLPDGSVEGPNGRAEIGYTGPCPPAGTHRYIFHLFALDKALDLAPDTSRDDLEIKMAGRILSKSELTGLYSSSQTEKE
jgi:hypothetical protein